MNDPIVVIVVCVIGVITLGISVWRINQKIKQLESSVYRINKNTQNTQTRSPYIVQDFDYKTSKEKI